MDWSYSLWVILDCFDKKLTFIDHNGVIYIVHGVKSDPSFCCVYLLHKIYNFYVLSCLAQNDFGKVIEYKNMPVIDLLM